MRAERAVAARGSAKGAWAVVVAACALVLALAQGSFAQERSTLIRMLDEARDFRVRVRAALALGGTGDASAVAPLSSALREDESDAVRAAAASALAALGSSEGLSALQAARTDRSSDVREAAESAIRTLASASRAGTTSGSARASGGSSAGSSGSAGRMPAIEVMPPARDIDWGATRYAVVIGAMENRSSFSHTGLAAMLEHEVQRGLVVLRGVAVLGGAAHPEAAREIERRSIPSFRMEGSIGTLEREHTGGQVRVRCDVSILLLDEPGRNLRAALNASATAAEEAASSASARTAQERLLAEQALEAAADRAMGGAARALSGAAH
jgi:hypothetical protein